MRCGASSASSSGSAIATTSSVGAAAARSFAIARIFDQLRPSSEGTASGAIAGLHSYTRYAAPTYHTALPHGVAARACALTTTLTVTLPMSEDKGLLG